MLSKNRAKLINALRYKKQRKKNGLFIAEGPKILNEIKNSNYKLNSIYATEKGVALIPSDIPEHLIYQIKAQTLKQISQLTNPNELLALVHLPQEKEKTEVLVDNWVLAIDGLQNPGNLGTVLRTIDWFGFRQVFCSPDTVDAFNPKVVQATMGSLFHLDVHYQALEGVLEKKEYTVYGLASTGKSLYQTSLRPPGIVLIGNEAQGIRKNLQRIVDQTVSIPRYGNAESLNAGIAAAITLSHIRAGEVNS